MTVQEKIDRVLADGELPAASKACYLQLMQAGGSGKFDVFSANNSDHPKELQDAVKKLVMRKYITQFRDEYEVA